MFGAMNPTLIAALVSLALGFGGGWTSNGWRLNAEIAQIKKTQAEAVTKGVTESMEKTVQYQRKKDEALQKAESRAAANAASAATARAESDRLRALLASSSGTISRATHDSLVGYATALSDVFGECQAAAAGLAEKATGHAADVKTLMEAWPK